MTEEGARAFARTLENLSEGDLHHDLSKAQHELLTKLREMVETTCVAEKGSLVLKLDYELDPTGDLLVKGKVDVKVPVAPARISRVWASKGGNVLLEPPSREKRGPVREVVRNNEAPREVAGREGT